MATAITGCGDDPVFYAQGPGLNPEPFVRGKQVIAAAIGDDGPALARKNPALFAPDVALTEPNMFRGDLRLDYDDGTLRYQGCAWRIFADASKAAWDGVAYAGDSGEIEHDKGLTLIVADGCLRYSSPEEVAAAAEAVLQQVLAAGTPTIEVVPRYDQLSHLSQIQDSNGVDCPGPIEALVQPLQELRCVYDRAADVWNELDDSTKRVTYARLLTPTVRFTVDIIATLPSNITVDSSSSPPREIMPREQLRPTFYLSVSFASRDMEKRPPPVFERGEDASAVPVQDPQPD